MESTGPLLQIRRVSSFSFAVGDDVDFRSYHEVQDIKTHKIWFPKN